MTKKFAYGSEEYDNETIIAVQEKGIDVIDYKGNIMAPVGGMVIQVYDEPQKVEQ